MELIRGTTPTIVIYMEEQIDFSQVKQVWIYISQNKKVIVDKEISDVTFNQQKQTITLTLAQKDTINLKAGEAKFQIRLVFNDTTALATIAEDIEILEIYKSGIIE